MSKLSLRKIFFPKKRKLKSFWWKSKIKQWIIEANRKLKIEIAAKRN